MKDVKDIVWTDAPEWATAHGYHQGVGFDVWFNDEKYQYDSSTPTGPYLFAGPGDWCLARRDEITNIVEKPKPVDWSEAPEGTLAVGYCHLDRSVTRMWLKKDKYAYAAYSINEYSYGDNPDHPYNRKRDSFFWVEQRPVDVGVPAVPWDGVDSAPIGADARLEAPCGTYRVRVLAYLDSLPTHAGEGRKCVVVQESNAEGFGVGNVGVFDLKIVDLFPVPTPEEEAAAARRHSGVETLIRIYGLTREQATRMIEDGFVATQVRLYK